MNACIINDTIIEAKMLQIKNIKKEYRTGTLVQKALDDVSLNLRNNEFVAILGSLTPKNN